MLRFHFYLPMTTSLFQFLSSFFSLLYMSRALQLNVASSCVLPVKSVTTSILTTRQHTSYGVFIYSSTIPIHTFFCCSIQMVLVCVCVCDVYMVLVLVRSPFARATPIQTLCIFLSLETIVQRPPDTQWKSTIKLETLLQYLCSFQVNRLRRLLLSFFSLSRSLIVVCFICVG